MAFPPTATEKVPFSVAVVVSKKIPTPNLEVCRHQGEGKVKVWQIALKMSSEALHGTELCRNKAKLSNLGFSSLAHILRGSLQGYSDDKRERRGCQKKI